MSGPVNRLNHLPRSLPRDLTPIELSIAMLHLRGHVLLCGVEKTAGLPLDLTAIDRRTLRPLLVSVVVEKGERFGVLMQLLGRDDLGELVRAGCLVEVHTWGKRGRYRVVDVIELRAEDYVEGK